VIGWHRPSTAVRVEYASKVLLRGVGLAHRTALLDPLKGVGMRFADADRGGSGCEEEVSFAAL
jgi:hypothetical protein